MSAPHQRYFANVRQPDQLREIIHELKANLSSPDLSFGVDLALPKVGEGARKTNHDYTHGQLDGLITVTSTLGFPSCVLVLFLFLYVCLILLCAPTF